MMLVNLEKNSGCTGGEHELQPLPFTIHPRDIEGRYPV